MKGGLALLAAVLVAGAARAACPVGLHAVHSTELFFGRDIGAGVGVSEADWQSFLDTEVAPRFPAGFTTWDAQGEWRGAGAASVREPSKVLLLVGHATDAERARIAAIVAAYKARFHQQSVLVVEQAACAAF